MENLYENLLQRSNRVKYCVSNKMAQFDSETLNWKQTEKKWSIIEVVDHLNKVYDIYLPNFEEAITSAPELNGKIQEKQQTIVGRLSVYAMKPKGKKRRFKMKTFDFFQPRINVESNKVLAEFNRKKQKFNDLIKGARNKNLVGIKMSTSLKLMRFYVPECFDFILTHEERHLIQMEEILANATQLNIQQVVIHH
ncbi:MAG: DinB family protein [Bacteroidota bacterium]